MGFSGAIWTIVALVVAFVLTAGTASATTRHSRVVFQGTGSYGLHYVAKSGETFRLSATFRFETVIPHASFTQGLTGARQLAALHSSAYSGSWTASVTGPGGTHVCRGSGRFGGPAHGTPAPALTYAWSSSTDRFRVDSFNGLPGNKLRTTDQHADDCSSQLASASAGATPSADFWRDWVQKFSQLGGSRHDLLDARFSFPGSFLSERSATESMSVIGSSFPGACRTLGFKTCTQSYKWNGTVGFTRAD